MKSIRYACAVALATTALPASAAQIILAPGNVYASTGALAPGFAADNILDQQTGVVESIYGQTYWLNPDSGPSNPSISIDLGGAYRLGSFDLFNSNNIGDRGTGQFSIIASNDAAFGTFVTVVQGTLTAATDNFPIAQSFSSASNGLFRYLQFRPTSVASPGNPASSNAYALTELRVFDAPLVTSGVPEPSA